MLFKKMKMIDFLTDHKDSIVNQLQRSFHIEDKADLLLELFIEKVQEQETSLTESLQSLAKKIATERFINKVDMEDFTTMITTGRAIMIIEIVQSDMAHDEKIQLIEPINDVLDRLMHRTLIHYADLQAKLLEEQYYFISQTHKDRLMLLGQMTSSFVHEFRNPLTSIIGFIQLLQSEQPDGKYLAIISEELDQLTSRITQFLSFSKKDHQQAVSHPFSISQLIQEVVDFLYPSVLEVKATVSCNITSDVYINGSKEEIRQVLLNIILNALDVISTVPSPSIYISDTPSPVAYLLTISNNGPKIAEDVLPTIFEPFVTTKKQGTGLGLFVCKEIIENHKGTLTCTSSDLITTFTIHLPI